MFYNARALELRNVRSVETIFQLAGDEQYLSREDR